MGGGLEHGELADRDPAATTAAIVLAAGFSSRMGAFKPLLPFGERTLVDHVVTNLRAAGVERIHVVTGFQADALAPELTRLGVTRAHNPDFAAGMFSSVQAGVASLPADVDAFLLAPVDVPLLRPSTIARVLRAAATRDSAIVYPTFRGERGHPPLVRRALFAEILNSDGDGGLRALLARHEGEASEVAVFDWGCLVDMDRRDDYRRLAAALAGHRLPDVAECEAMFDAAATPKRRAATAAPSPRWRRAWRGGCKRRARRSIPIWRARRRSSTTSPKAAGVTPRRAPRCCASSAFPSSRRRSRVT